MKLSNQIRSLPGKIKKQFVAAVTLACAIATFAAPAFTDGYSVLKAEPVVSSASAIEDIDLLLVGASAFGEAKQVIYASDNDKIDIFINNTSTILSGKWQNMGLLVGARDSLSGTIWNAYQSPITLSDTEVANYNNTTIAWAYQRYKAFGLAVRYMFQDAAKSKTAAMSTTEGLDAMSVAAIKLGSFGTEFLNDYNPAPVLLALYDSSNLATYSNNKLVQFVVSNTVIKNIICLFGDKVGNTGLSFFVIINAVIAIIGFAMSLILTLLGNRNIGDGVRKFISRVVIGTVGIYVIGNLMSTLLGWTTSTILNVGASDTIKYIESNLNIYDWYQTGFQLPPGITLEIDAKGEFKFTPDIVREINYYTYNRLIGGATDDNIRQRMETISKFNLGAYSFVMPSMTNSSSGEADDQGASSWATDAYYAIMDNYAQNKEDLLDGKDEEGSPLADKWSVKYASQYFYMSTLSMLDNGSGGWTIRNYNSNNDYYGINPISAFNMIRSDFSGNNIKSSSVVSPNLPMVGFNVVDVINYPTTGSTNMNSITRFIASFTLVLAAMKGLITIFTAGFGGMLSGGVKTATGSAGGLGQAIGGVIALFCGIIGISVIMSISLSLIDSIYGICKGLLVGSQFTDALVEPIRDSLSSLPFGIGDMIAGAVGDIVDMILSLILALTFPKLGNIPITVFAQFMADLPGRMAEKAQMIEGMLMSGRSSAGGGGLGGHGGRGQYGRQAQQMAGQAFSGAQKQAAAVLAAGASAAGALAGASLSAAGRALNKKADGLEGKPSNPGVKNWDEMSPEQQSAAAEAAANTENWKDMDEDARQKALQEAGVYGENGAEAAGQAGETEGNIGDADDMDMPESIGAEDMGNGEPPTEGDAETLSDVGGDSGIPDAGPESSMSGGADTDMPPVDGDMASADASMADAADGGTPETGAAGEDGAAGGNIGDSEDASGAEYGDMADGSISDEGMSGEENVSGGDSISGDDAESGADISYGAESGDASGASIAGGESGDNAPSGDVAGDGGSVNVNEGDNVEGSNQHIDANVEQNSRMDAKNVDESRQLNKEESSSLENSSMDSRSTSNNKNTSVPGGAAGGKSMAAGAAAGAAAKTGGMGTPGAQGMPGHGTGTPGAPGQGGSGNMGGHKSVNNSSHAGNSSRVNVNASAQQKAQFNKGGDQNRTVNNTGQGTVQGTGQQKPGTQGAGSPQGRNARPGQGPAQGAGRNAGNGASGRSMNGTSTSKWGKEMDLKQQKQARALHAAGDALQMMGGNRTMGEGIAEALSYAKDAAIAYTVPESSNFMNSLRIKRLEQQKKREMMRSRK